MKRAILFIGMIAIAAAPVWAHEGSRIWIDNVSGKITTYTSNDDNNPTVYTPSRLFQTTLTNFFNVHTTEFPGYEVRRTGAHVANNTTFGFFIGGPLLVFDDVTGGYMSTQSKYGASAPQMALSIEEETRITGTGGVSGFDFLTYTGPGGGDHGHLSYTQVDGSGAPIPGPLSAVYALPMKLSGSGLALSDTYILLIGKGVSQGSPLFNQATSVMQDMLDSPGDANLDGKVDASDLGVLGLNWLGTGAWSKGDFNFDGQINVLDSYQLATHWGNGVIPPLSTALVPEPSGVLSLLVLACPLMRRRRANL